MHWNRPDAPWQRVLIAGSAEDAAATVAEHWIDIARAAVVSTGRFVVAISGGDTPKMLFRQLASLAPGRLPWDVTEIYWADERMVPPSDNDSNFLHAKQELLDLVPVPAEQIHRIYGETTPDAAAERYQQELAALAKSQGHEVPMFDLILLGMGDDGHTASLFPGSNLLTDFSHLAGATFHPGKKQWRISMTYPTINAAHHLVIFVTSAQKSQVVRQVLSTKSTKANDESVLPIGRVKPQTGSLTWVLDRDAAGALLANP